MNAVAPKSEPVTTAAPSAASAISLAEINASCRMPLLTMFISAAVWLVIGSAFG